MPNPSSADSSLTQLLQDWRNGNGNAFSAVIDQVYDELRTIAAQRVGRSGNCTLSPTELLHDALIKVGPTPMDWANRAHFFASMSLVIRSTLVDHARARAAEKRGGECVRVTLTGLEVGEESMAADLLALEQALTQLEALDPRCGKVMHLTHFGGLSREDVAELLKISIPTVDRDLRFARAWLTKAFDGET